MVKTSLVDFPGHVAAACFLRGCNLRCPYCYNTALVIPYADESERRGQNAAQKKLSQDENLLQDHRAASINGFQTRERGANKNFLHDYKAAGGDLLQDREHGADENFLRDHKASGGALWQDYNAASINGFQDRERGGADENQAQNKNAAPTFVRLEAVVEHLKKRKNVLTGLAISGGEPLLFLQAVRFLTREARALGLKVKLDTNGLFPDALESLLADAEARPDYIALDVKTSPARYAELCGAAFRADKNRTQDKNAASGNASQDRERAANENFLKDRARGGADGDFLQDKNRAAEKIARSIQIVSALPSDAREFRTVLYPPLVSATEIKEIAALLPPDARWYFARFMNGRCLDAGAEKIAPYSEAEERALLAAAKKIIPGAEIR